MHSSPSLMAGLALFFAATPILAQVITPAPVAPEPNRVKRDGDLTLAITNSYGMPLSLSFGNNAGFPAFYGNPQPTLLPIDGSVAYNAPAGWAGRVSVGKVNHDDNSKIEGSFYGPGNGDIDVSYVDGYSVPITCSVGGKVVSGCNIELFDRGCNAPDSVSAWGPDNRIAACHNAAQGVPDGPASSMFAPCAGAAYTFPKDDGANTGMIAQTEMSCCIGILCPPSPKQRWGKRDVESPKAPTLKARALKV
ncbi:MAG: hypothetical protein L6R37_004372 [Teloschistes peruensis]|nr:MAG: hypothetical protein L6R37_004372 [Teloschistes peruensis]